VIEQKGCTLVNANFSLSQSTKDNQSLEGTVALKTFEGFATACRDSARQGFSEGILGRGLSLRFKDCCKPQLNLSLKPVIKDTDDPVNKSKLTAKANSSRETRKSVSKRTTDWFRFTSDWMTKWHEVVKPISLRSNESRCELITYATQ